MPAATVSTVWCNCSASTRLDSRRRWASARKCSAGSPRWSRAARRSSVAAVHRLHLAALIGVARRVVAGVLTQGEPIARVDRRDVHEIHLARLQRADDIRIVIAGLGGEEHRAATSGLAAAVAQEGI